ncbi:hypothetical protein LPJ55_003620 [Coemansia sp. RSA 990]|nr:hypothetical protein LPJ79_003400 [Coemansia sp. RSA 1821]KAJ1871788.1 hypothetical protein LPJ55_003620 [Coemansia sp. RSA 990]KAJ2668873.1 hypothetical protein IWW42_004931 [Coemansia sp. RSA 1085]
MANSPEPSRKRQRTDRRQQQQQAQTSASAMVTRSRSRSAAQIASRQSLGTTNDSDDSSEVSQNGVVLTSKLLCELRSEKDVIAKLIEAFLEPCTLARSFPQKDALRALDCPVDAADVRSAYTFLAKKSKRVRDELRRLTIDAINTLNSEPCDEHDSQMNAVLIMLLNPKITEYTHDDDTPVFPELCSAILNQPPSQRSTLMQYFAASDAVPSSNSTPAYPALLNVRPSIDEQLLASDGERESFERYLNIFQKYVTQEMVKAAQRIVPPASAGSEPATQKVSLHTLGGCSLVVVAQCMALINSYNNTHKVVPYTAFYNDAVNEHADIKEDVPRFRMPDGISFCSYPFLLSPTTKSEIIRIESVILMRTELQDSFFRAMFSGVTCPYLVLEVRRDNLVRDTLYQLDLKFSQDLRKQLKVRFVGEEGVDEGGVQKEFFQLIVRDVFSPKYGIFKASENTHFYWFRPQLKPAKDSLEEIRLTGQLIGLAVYNAVILDIHLPPAMYKKLLGVSVTREDLREVDPELYHGLMQLLNLTTEELEFLERTFEIEYEDLGELRTHELIPGGAHTLLTIHNRDLFIDKYVDFVFNTGCEKQFSEFKSGFDRICGSSYVRHMRPQELELLVCGCSDLDFTALERSTIYDGGYSKETTVIQYFWRVVGEFTDELKRKLLFFATSSDRVPIGGLSKLHFVIAKNGGDSDRLPTSHTCFNVLLLPEYSSLEKLRERLLTAIHNSEGFGMI